MALTTTPQNLATLSCPEFSLPGTDGRTWTKKDLINGKPFLVLFICNHCPYVQAIEDRLIILAQDLEKLDIKMLAISSNDHPDDSFVKMQERAGLKKYPFPYLYDETQAVAKSFGAVCTPDVFLFDQSQVLRYRGRLDDSWKDASRVTKRELFEAALALVESRSIPQPVTPSMGCSIKWKGDVE